VHLVASLALHTGWSCIAGLPLIDQSRCHLKLNTESMDILRVKISNMERCQGSRETLTLKQVHLATRRVGDWLEINVKDTDEVRLVHRRSDEKCHLKFHIIIQGKTEDTNSETLGRREQ